jgi:hypothetical protein
MRSVQGNVLTSADNPRGQVRVDPAFTYAGSYEFILKGIAHCERYHFVVAVGPQIKRLFMVQFEGFLPDNTYRYRRTDEYMVRMQPLRLGAHTYNHSTWFYDDAATAREEPGAESDRTRAFLQQQGYHLPDELMMSRFERLVDEAQRHEVIFFYDEDLRDTGFTAADLGEGGRAADQAERLAGELTARSLQCFAVVDSGAAGEESAP